MKRVQKYIASKCTDRFLAEEDGTVTVDWVVLTAGIVGVAAASGATILDATSVLSSSVSSGVSAKSVSNGD